MKIRRASKKDIKKITFWYDNPVVFFLSDPTLKYPFTVSDWLEFWSTQRERTLFVLEDQDEIVVAVSSKLTNNATELSHIYVDKKFRRMGYARKLINHVINLNQSTGYQVMINVLQREHVQLIESLGFRESADVFDHKFDGNNYQFKLYHRSHEAKL